MSDRAERNAALYDFFGQTPPPPAPKPAPPKKTPEREYYASTVRSAYNRPVISTQAAADALAGDDDAAQYLSGLQALYGQYMSPRQVARELAIRQQLGSWSASGKQVPGQFVQMWVDKMRSFEKPTKQDEAVLGVLTGYDPEKGTPQHALAMNLRGLVAQHAPGGKYASFGARSQKEQEELQRTYGDNANYMMTPESRRNHEALRVAELFSATDGNYGPASGFSQAARAVGGFAGPLVDMVRSVTTEPGVYDPKRTGEAWSEFGLMQQPDGKFQYAAQLWDRGEADRGTSSDLNAYAPDGQAKYAAYNPTTMEGLANATQINTSFPVARGYNNLAPVREIGMHVGNMLTNEGDNMVAALRDMRDKGNRISPVVPEGMHPADFEQHTKALKDADTAMDGWISAYYGPKSSDAWNATIGKLGPGMDVDRTYLSPAANTVMSVPGESISDPINLAMNVATGPVWGAARGAATSGMMGAGNHMIRGLIKMGPRMIDDAAEETVEEGAFVGPTLTGIDQFFQPETDNLMMGAKSPADMDYDTQQERKTLDSLDSRRRASDAWKRAQKPPGEAPAMSGPRYGARNPL